MSLNQMFRRSHSDVFTKIIVSSRLTECKENNCRGNSFLLLIEIKLLFRHLSRKLFAEQIWIAVSNTASDYLHKNLIFKSNVIIEVAKIIFYEMNRMYLCCQHVTSNVRNVNEGSGTLQIQFYKKIKEKLLSFKKVYCVFYLF